MAANDQPPAPRPLANMINEAKEGRLNLRMDLEQFVYLDRDCETFKDAIRRIQRIMDQVSQQETWGLGEHTHTADGKELISGKTLVDRFRTKSRGKNDQNDNSVYAIMESHHQAVEDIQNTYRAIRQRITDQDAEAAARYQQLEATLPQQPPVNPPPFFMANYA
ncbi:hypothetical protein GZH49_00970 [Nocardia terpenica]|uniref:hypothetical protein n=1 Tax=Nocardia terpenica TaxID=455432 RepID=UPI002FE20918